MTHRTARLPRFAGHHGDRVKGSIRWSPDQRGYLVIYSYLIGYESTTRASELYDRWTVAMGQYREHDRAVRERQSQDRNTTALLALRASLR